MIKKIVLYIHTTAGLLSGLFVLLMSLSGAALVYQDELDTARNSIFDPGAYRISVDSAYGVIQKVYPHAQISNCEIRSTGVSSFFINDSSYKKGEKAIEVFVHNQTGSIAGKRGAGDSFVSWLSTFHNSFHLGKAGEWLLGFFALVFLLSLFTGFILFRKNILAVLLFRKTVFTRSNLHQLIGVYALLFNLMIAVTGFWMQRYVFKKEFYQSYNYTPVLK
ncbi:MAG: PepSY-associated TM helix domain-containing protein, partial [Ferruginibacter sp.]